MREGLPRRSNDISASARYVADQIKLNVAIMALSRPTEQNAADANNYPNHSEYELTDTIMQ